MPILYIPSYTMYSRLFKNRQNQESFHNGLIATPLIPSAPDGQILIHTKLAELNDKQPLITPTQPIAIDFIDISQSIQTMTSQIDAQTETVQQLSQSNVLPIYVEGDTTVFETPVHASQISFPDETVQSSAWTASHISELERIAGIQEIEVTVDPLARLSDLLEESDILYRDVSIAYHVNFNPDAYIQSFQDVSGSIHATILSQQAFTTDFPAMLSTATASLTAIAETAEAIHTSGVYDLSLQFDPLPARLEELIGKSDQIYQDASLANHTAFDSSAYLNSFQDASESIYATMSDQQLFADNLAEILDTVSISLTDISEVAERMDVSITDLSNQMYIIANRMELVLQADESVRDLSFLNTIVSVDADLSITQLESLHVVLDTSTNTKFSGVSMVRTVSTDVSATALYMAPYSSGAYSASAPPSFLTNHAVIGQGGTNSMVATKPLTIANPTGTRGVRIPILSSDTTTRTELWSNLTVSGGSMNVSGIACSGEVYTSTPSTFLWDNVETLRTVALSSGRCTINWNQGQSWFISAGVNASFGITINNFPTDISKIYNLRLLYNSSGGYGSTLRIASSDVSLYVDQGISGGFINQFISIISPNVATSTLTYYSVPLMPINGYLFSLNNAGFTGDDTLSSPIGDTFTIEFYFRKTIASTGVTNIITIGDVDSTSTLTTACILYGNGGGFQFTSGEISAPKVNLRCAADEEINRWYHVAFVVKPTNDNLSSVVKLFMDGSNVQLSNLATGSADKLDLNNKVRLGRQIGTTSTFGRFKGNNINVTNIRVTNKEVYTGNFSPLYSQLESTQQERTNVTSISLSECFLLMQVKSMAQMLRNEITSTNLVNNNLSFGTINLPT